MRQFDVFKNPNPRTAKTVPWLLLVQHDLLSALETRLMAPLVPATSLGKQPISRLNPTFKVSGETVVLLAQQVGAVRTASLGKAVTNLEPHRSAIIGAIDVVLCGV